MTETRIRDVPTPLSPDPDILDRLREIDPDADLVYLGEGRWALGTVTPMNQFRRKRAEKMIARQYARGADLVVPSKLRLGKAALEGFRLVKVYEYTEVQSGYMAQEFWRMTHLWNSDRNAADREIFEDSKQIPDHVLEERVDRAINQARDAYAYLFKGRKHFVQGG